MTKRQFATAVEPLTTDEEILLHDNPVHASRLGLDRRAIVEQGHVPSDSGARTSEVFHAKSNTDAIRKESRGKSEPKAAFIIVHEDKLSDVIRVLRAMQRDQDFPIVEKGALSKGHNFEKEEHGYVIVPVFSNFSDKEKARLESKGGHVTMTTKSEVGRLVPSAKTRVHKQTGAAGFDM